MPGPTKTIRSAMSAIVEAMRAGYGAHSASIRRRCPTAATTRRSSSARAPVLEFLYGKYFRVRTVDIENVPADGPALLVANHSGGLPYDGAMLIYGLFRDHPAHRRLRTLVANFAFRSPWMSNVVARIGGVRASTETAMPLLSSGNLVGVFPEGLKGVGKMFRERYRLSRFGRGGFVRLARAGERADHPGRDRRRRGDPPGAGQDHLAGRAARAFPTSRLRPPFRCSAPWACYRYPPSGPSASARRFIARRSTATRRRDVTATTAEQVRHTIDAMIADLLAQRRSIIFG